MIELAIDSDANETLLAIRIRFAIKDRIEVEERSGTLNELSGHTQRGREEDRVTDRERDKVEGSESRRREGERKSGYLRKIRRVEPIKELHLDVVPDPLLVVHPQILPIAMFLIENLQMRTRINSDDRLNLDERYGSYS
jgi:hypothetical protein